MRFILVDGPRAGSVLVAAGRSTAPRLVPGDLPGVGHLYVPTGESLVVDGHPAWAFAYDRDLERDWENDVILEGGPCHGTTPHQSRLQSDEWWRLYRDTGRSRGLSEAPEVVQRIYQWPLDAEIVGEDVDADQIALLRPLTDGLLLADDGQAFDERRVVAQRVFLSTWVFWFLVRSRGARIVAKIAVRWLEDIEKVEENQLTRQRVSRFEAHGFRAYVGKQTDSAVRGHLWVTAETGLALKPHEEVLRQTLARIDDNVRRHPALEAFISN